MAIDCEMDLKAGQQKITAKNPGLVCKVSIVNENGEIVLDTLVNYKPIEAPIRKRRGGRKRKASVEVIADNHYESMFEIHGIHQYDSSFLCHG